MPGPAHVLAYSCRRDCPWIAAVGESWIAAVGHDVTCTEWVDVRPRSAHKVLLLLLLLLLLLVLLLALLSRRRRLLAQAAHDVLDHRDRSPADNRGEDLDAHNPR